MLAALYVQRCIARVGNLQYYTDSKDGLTWTNVSKAQQKQQLQLEMSKVLVCAQYHQQMSEKTFNGLI